VIWQILRQVVRVGICPKSPEGLTADPGTPTDPAVGPSAHGQHPASVDDLSLPCHDDSQRMQADLRKALGRALASRVVDAGSSNGCELEINALGNPFYNIEGEGIQFVASPRHADMLLVTGPVTRNMEQALIDTWRAMPAPGLVVAVGDCGCSGGIFGEAGACIGRVSRVIPVDATVAGCPPAPMAILAAIRDAVRSTPSA
jgi:Ni,Fe-hydrogenase III small subunit